MWDVEATINKTGLFQITFDVSLNGKKRVLSKFYQGCLMWNAKATRNRICLFQITSNISLNGKNVFYQNLAKVDARVRK